MFATTTAAFANGIVLSPCNSEFRGHCRRRRIRVLCCDTSRTTSVPANDWKPKDVDPRSAEVSAIAAAAATLVLKRAADKPFLQRPKAGKVINALLQLEREQKRHKVKTDICELCGEWKLLATGNKKKKSILSWPMYFPFRTQLEFHAGEHGPESGIIENAVFFAGTSVHFAGPYRWVAKNNRMEFTFSKMAVKIGPIKPFVFDDIDREGGTLESRTAKTLPFFTFFYARNNLMAARGRTGGVALFQRVEDK